MWNYVHTRLQAVDIYLGMCYFMVVCTLIEYAFVGYSSKKRKDLQKKVDETKSVQTALPSPIKSEPQQRPATAQYVDAARYSPQHLQYRRAISPCQWPPHRTH